MPGLADAVGGADGAAGRGGLALSAGEALVWEAVSRIGRVLAFLAVVACCLTSFSLELASGTVDACSHTGCSLVLPNGAPAAAIPDVPAVRSSRGVHCSRARTIKPQHSSRATAPFNPFHQKIQNGNNRHNRRRNSPTTFADNALS